MIHKNISYFHGPSNSIVHCETQIDYCSPNPCLNGGSCSKWGFFGYKCLCSANYTGKNCQNINYCNGVQTCLNVVFARAVEKHMNVSGMVFRCKLSNFK
jgi:hypothetical protein